MQSLYGSPPGRSFCAYKRNQNTLGAAPQDPLTLKLRLDTNDAKASSVQRRRYALKVPAAHFMLGNCKPIAGSHDVEPMGWISSCLPRRPLPRCGASSFPHKVLRPCGGPRRSRSGRAFRCVGVLGFTPSRFWALLASQKCHPAGQACLLKPRKRLAPPEVITDHVTNAPAASRTNWAF